MSDLQKSFCLVASAFCLSNSIAAQNSKPGVIPTLREWKGGEGTFTITNQSRIVLSKVDQAALLSVAKTLQDDLRVGFDLNLKISIGVQPKPSDIRLGLDSTLSGKGPESYRLSIQDRVNDSASTPKGVFYGTRTLLQLIALDAKHRVIPQGSALDWPDYGERGFMLDVGRKFFDIRFLRDYVRFMSWFKLNDFQLHLNDNAAHDYAGFRLNSIRFPSLASKDGAYTRKQISDLQDLAASYFVNITPEIDAPAHARAITKYRPELGNPKLPKDHLDLSNPKTQAFVNELWKEFIPWFRSPSVHIGADEYNGGPGSAKYYKAYINSTAAFIRSQGKKVQMWGGLKTAGNSDGVDRDIVVSLWYPGYHDPLAAVKDGYNIINTHDGYLYIVPFAGYYYQFLDSASLYKTWKPNVFDNEVLPDNDPHVLGGMFAVWNDKAAYPYTFEDVHELVKPAMSTLGEILWSGHPTDARTYDAFAADAKRLGDGPAVQIPSPIVKQEPGDLAFRKTTTASTSVSGDFGSQTLTDGRSATRWIADAKNPQWVSIDLGETKTISQVTLKWVPDSFPRHYALSTSSDGKEWRRFFETFRGKDGTETIRFASTSSRFIRLDCLEKGGTEGSYSLFAIEAYK